MQWSPHIESGASGKLGLFNLSRSSYYTVIRQRTTSFSIRGVTLTTRVPLENLPRAKYRVQVYQKISIHKIHFFNIF